MKSLVKIFKYNLSAGKDFNKICTSETTRTNPYFNYWLAGLIDGDGCLNISKKGYVSCEIVTHSKEISALEYVQSILKGSVSKKTENSCRWRLHNKEGLRDLIYRINGKLLTESKNNKLKLICQKYGILYIEPNNNTNLLENSWFCGFFDAEGSLNFHTSAKEARVQIAQKNKKILEIISKSFKGNIYFDKSWEGYILEIKKKEDVLNLLNYFENFELKIKHNDLKFFKELIRMKDLGYHLPNSDKHCEFLNTLQYLKNRK